MQAKKPWYFTKLIIQPFPGEDINITLISTSDMDLMSGTTRGDIEVTIQDWTQHLPVDPCVRQPNPHN